LFVKVVEVTVSGGCSIIMVKEVRFDEVVEVTVFGGLPVVVFDKVLSRV